MAKKLLVRTPVTRDGITLVYDENRQPRFKETIVEPWARKEFESLNSSMAEHLRHELIDIEVSDGREKQVNPVALPADNQAGVPSGKSDRGRNRSLI